MIAREATWAEVKRGSFIKDKNGMMWKVVHVKPGFYGVQNKAGEQHILKDKRPHDPVDIMYLSQKELINILETDFGAETHSIKESGHRVYITQRLGTAPADIRSHLMLMHGEYSVDVKSAKALNEMHEELHHRKKQTRWIPHIHKDRLPKGES